MCLQKIILISASSQLFFIELELVNPFLSRQDSGGLHLVLNRWSERLWFDVRRWSDRAKSVGVCGHSSIGVQTRLKLVLLHWLQGSEFCDNMRCLSVTIDWGMYRLFGGKKLCTWYEFRLLANPFGWKGQTQDSIPNKNGLFQFAKMPFGLTNAPATVQRMVNSVLSGLIWSAVIAYLDDINEVDEEFDDTLANVKIWWKCWQGFVNMVSS